MVFISGFSPGGASSGTSLNFVIVYGHILYTAYFS